MMDSQSNKQHWDNWAKEHGGSVRATTMSETAKALEIEALYRRLKDMPAGTRVLEAGCGNGINCVELANRLPTFKFDGFDYAPNMIQAAKELKKSLGFEAIQGNINFFVGDVLNMDEMPLLQLYIGTQEIRQDTYDVVITDRCLINLSSLEKQKQAIVSLASKLRPGGTLLMIENLVEGRERQNRFRELLGLETRPLMPPFNRFFTAAEIDEAIMDAGFQEYDIEHFSSLHDLMLYVFVPAIHPVSHPLDYEHPLVKTATELSIKSPNTNFGNFGQNVLFICRKP